MLDYTGVLVVSGRNSTKANFSKRCFCHETQVQKWIVLWHRQGHEGKFSFSNCFFLLLSVHQHCLVFFPLYSLLFSDPKATGRKVTHNNSWVYIISIQETSTPSIQKVTKHRNLVEIKQKGGWITCLRLKANKWQSSGENSYLCDSKALHLLLEHGFLTFIV